MNKMICRRNKNSCFFFRIFNIIFKKKKRYSTDNSKPLICGPENYIRKCPIIEGYYVNKTHN